MTDIDAIRKRDDEFAAVLEPVEHADGEHTVDCQCDGVQAIHDRRALRRAYDAKCEELARQKAGWAEAFRLAVYHQERANKAEAERDAAVREREGLRVALKDANAWLRSYGSHDAVCPRNNYGTIVDCTCGYTKALQLMVAAIAPPTEQPCSRCHGKTTIKTINLRRPFAGAMTEPCPDCQPSDREVMP